MSLDRTTGIAAAALAAFIAWALLTDYLPSLRWIPYAFLAGCGLTVAASLYLILLTSQGVRRQDDHGLRYGVPAPAFSASRDVWEEEKATLTGRGEYRRPTIFPDVPGFSSAVDGLLDLVLRDFVTAWYGQISRRPWFQNEIDRCIRSALLSITARLSELDLVALGTSKLLPIITRHLKDFYDAERAVRGKDLSNNVTESDELSTAIAGKYGNGRLHAVASLAYPDPVAPAQSHFRELMDGLLPLVLPANMLSSRAVTTLVREMGACVVLAPISATLADPDFWNQTIVNISGTALQDRKTVRRVRAALDQHATIPPRAARSAQLPRLRPYDGERQFERFIRAIRHINTLTEARRFRSEIATQLRRDSSLEGQDAAYLRRLETGRRLLDQRVSDLAAHGHSGPSAQHTQAQTDPVAQKREASLREVLYDAAGLGYFMEWMDRQNLMRLVQFYLVVDGFRNPLEADTDEPPTSVANDPDRMDIGQMYEAYLTQPELQTPVETLQVVKQYLRSGKQATVNEYTAARRAVLESQTRNYGRMTAAFFEDFKRSDLYFQWLAIAHNPSFPAVQSKQAESLSLESSRTRGLSPAATRRPQLAAVQKGSELRRAVLSTSNLKDSGSPREVLGESARRSLDGHNTRTALFGDDVEDERMVQSASSLRSYDSDGEAAQEAQDQAKAVNNMQAALDKIVGDDDDLGLPIPDPSMRNHSADANTVLDQEALRILPSSGQASSSGRPNIASLGLVGAPSSHGVFVDDLFSEEAEKHPEDDRDDLDAPTQTEDEQIQEAAPGDLGLAEAIDVLNADIERLSAQRSVLDSLSAKAELTNNLAEMRILQKSEQSLQREIKRKEMQKQQYIVQESDNSLHGRAVVNITSVMVGREEDGREFALYVIEVHRQAGDQTPLATWAITRRYSQFHELHKRLKARFPSVKQLDFPRRQALFTLQKDFIQKRRVTLERYLRSLLLVPAICRSRELRAFLSQSAITTDGQGGTQVDAKDFVTRIYNSVTDGMEEFLGNIPVLDQLSVAGQNLISAASAQIGSGSPIESLDPAMQDVSTAAEAEAELNAYEVKEDEPFVKPICDVFLETFELSKGSSWLRGRTVIVILHQLLGGTIERKVRETSRNALQDESMARLVETFKGVMWPSGKPRPPGIPRTAQEKARTKKEAAILLGALIPDIAGSVVGKGNAQAASRKIIAVLNNPRLNTHLIFSLIDEIMRLVFPELET